MYISQNPIMCKLTGVLCIAVVDQVVIMYYLFTPLIERSSNSNVECHLASGRTQ